MASTGGMTRERAELIAAQALQFLASDEGRLARFLGLTGIDGGAIRDHVGEPVFLAGVLDYLLADESLLLEWVESSGLAPEEPGLARAALADCIA
jgi:hypothetical protein